MILPSISEDDENQSDQESKHSPSPSRSGILMRSPLHSAPSPRHSRFLQKYEQNFLFASQILRVSLHVSSIYFYSNRGKSLATLREKVERQRSVQSSFNHEGQSNSLEGLNLERGNPSQKSQFVDQLDNQVITLHHDVAALSVEV